MGIGSLHSIPNLQHSDVLEKLKMQVRDMKVGLMVGTISSQIGNHFYEALKSVGNW